MKNQKEYVERVHTRNTLITISQLLNEIQDTDLAKSDADFMGLIVEAFSNVEDAISELED